MHQVKVVWSELSILCTALKQYVIRMVLKKKKNSWSNANAVLSGVGGQKFKSRTGQIEHMVANGSPPLRYFFERSRVARAQ